MERTFGAARARMLQRRAELLKLVEQGQSVQKELHREVEADWPDRAQEETAEQLLDSLSDRERKEVLDIDAALARMSDGTYGLCVACGGAIGRGRLEAIPWARLCVECEERAERAA